MLVEFFASFRFSALSATAWNPGSIVAYYIGLFWLGQLPHKAFARRLFVPCFLLAVIAAGIGYWNANRPQAYLLSEWNHHAVLVQVKKGHILLFNDGMDADKLQRVLFALGVTKADFAAGFDSEKTELALLARQTKIPFEEFWPGEQIALPGATLRAAWELRLTKDGHIWEDTGYSGRSQSGLSYCVQKGKREICVGNHAWFLRLPSGETVTGVLNDTKKVSW